MNNSRFWNQGTAAVSAKSPKQPSGNKNLMKGLGATGLILITVIALVLGTGYIFIVRPALALSANLESIKKDGTAISDSLRKRDLVELEKNLVKTESDLEQVRKDREDKFGWAKNLKVFKINEFYGDSDRLINAGYYSIDALREIAKVVTPFADAAGLRVKEEDVVSEDQGLMEAFQSWVTLMPEVAGQMDGVIEKVAKIGDELQPIDTSKYPEKIRGVEVRSTLDFVKNTLSQANDYGPDLKQALTIFPRLLAVGTPEKRYMMIMQNDKELRPTGGFMTNYATFKIKDGLLSSDFSSKDMYSIDLTLDIIDATYDFPDAPQPYPKYLKVERWYARDMNFSPDFVTSMDQLLKFYKMAGNINPIEIKPVDGIIGIDTQVIRELLDVTGPVTVNGVTYNSENVVFELERIASLELREQQNRKRVLGDLMEAMLINVFESDKNLWSKLIDKGVDLAMRKHIQAYVFDPEAQALVEKYGVGGRITEETKGDYSMIVSTNLGGDKTNWFASKKVTQTLEKQGDKWIKTVKLDYSYPEPAGDFAPFVKRFRDWVRVYAPIGSTFIGVEGSEDGTMTDQERNKVWFSGYVELGPNETKSMTFKYELPKDAVTGDTYVLDLQKQGGIDKEEYTIVVNGKSQVIELTKDTKVTVKLN